MKNPELKRSNARYKGPRESKKRNEFFLFAYRNVQNIKDGLDEIRSLKDFELNKDEVAVSDSIQELQYRMEDMQRRLTE